MLYSARRHTLVVVCRAYQPSKTALSGRAGKPPGWLRLVGGKLGRRRWARWGLRRSGASSPCTENRCAERRGGTPLRPYASFGASRWPRLWGRRGYASPSASASATGDAWPSASTTKLGALAVGVGREAGASPSASGVWSGDAGRARWQPGWRRPSGPARGWPRRLSRAGASAWASAGRRARPTRARAARRAGPLAGRRRPLLRRRARRRRRPGLPGPPGARPVGLRKGRVGGGGFRKGRVARGLPVPWPWSLPAGRRGLPAPGRRRSSPGRRRSRRGCGYGEREARLPRLRSRRRPRPG